MEPPRPRPPRRARQVLKPELTRLAAAAAAVALAASSRSDAAVLAVALALAVGRLVASIGVVTAISAVVLRWGSSSLGAVAGAQAVLGPAGWTGGAVAVGSTWAAAAAVLLAAPAVGSLGAPRALEPLAAAVPFGLATALVAVGPGPGGALVLRVLAAGVATAVALVLGRKPARVSTEVRHRSAATLGVIALVLGGLTA